ncbi:hypothetical protein T492DRAFT_1061294 [Pavlovales sp. CCMP2436]|nr:hypothetical protein T492DRAFT_1061294 [Pavlovales sp. CCMP2436]
MGASGEIALLASCAVASQGRARLRGECAVRAPLTHECQPAPGATLSAALNHTYTLPDGEGSADW